MKKSLTFLGLAFIIVGLVNFLFRLIPVPSLQGRTLWLVVFGVVGLVLIILSFVLKSGKKFFLWFGLGAILSAVLTFVLRYFKLDNNTTLLIIGLIIGLLLLIIGLIKRG